MEEKSLGTGCKMQLKEVTLWDFSNEVSHFEASIFFLFEMRQIEFDCQNCGNLIM